MAKAIKKPDCLKSGASPTEGSWPSGAWFAEVERAPGGSRDLVTAKPLLCEWGGLWQTWVSYQLTKDGSLTGEIQKSDRRLTNVGRNIDINSKIWMK